MQKINFHNLPNTTTPINETNLNALQTNVEGAFSGTKGTSAVDTYNQQYLNNHLVNISNEVDEDYRANLLETKNLFNYKDITQSANYTNQGDGSFVRTSDGRSITINCNSSSQPYGDFKLKKGTYSLSFDILLTGAMTMGNLNIQTYQNGTLVNIAKSLNIPIPANTLTHIVAEEVVLENDAEAVGFASFLSPSGTNVGITISNIQFEKGSSATTYSSFVPNQIVVDNEKYTDTLNVGTSVDNRSRVNVLKSKNLFDYTSTVKRNSNATPSLITNGIKITPSQANGWSLWIIKDVSNYVGKKFTMKSTFSGGKIAFALVDSNGYNITNLVDTTSSNTDLTCTIPNLSNATYLAIQLFGSTTGTSAVDYTNIEVEEGEQTGAYLPYKYASINVDSDTIYQLLKETIDISSYKSNNVGTITRAKVIRNDNIYYFNMDFNITTSGNTITLFTGTPIQPSDTSNLIAVNDSGETSRVYIQTNGNITMQRVPTANVTYHIVGCIII